MAFRPSRRLRRPPDFPAGYQARRRRPSWWSPVAAWAGTHRVLTGVGVTGLVCIAVALVAGGLIGHPSTPSAATAITAAPPTEAVTTDTGILAPIEPPLALAATAADVAPPATTGPARASTTTTPRRVVPTTVPPPRPSTHPATTTPPVVTPTTRTPTPTATVTVPVYVHAGDDCWPVGATGVTELGTHLVCGTTVTSPTRPRWH